MTGLLIEDRLLDVGYGTPIQLSSWFGTGAPPPFLIPATDPGAPFFRTHVEAAPAITIDLRTVRHVSRIRVFDNASEPFHGVPLSLSLSQDGAAWSDIATVQADPEDLRTGAPLVIAFESFALCRYVRLQAQVQTSLRLYYVEICAPLPQEFVGKLLDIRVTDTDVLADYWHHDSYGFAWTFTCTLGMIFSARLLGVCIDRINYRLCLRGFKDDAEQDSYGWLFEARPRRRADQPSEIPAFERHGIYASFALDVLRRYADLYFRPHRRVREFADRLVADYGIDLSSTIVLLYRGTDKVIEVAPASPEDYVAVARSLMSAEDGLQVVCQTDQAQARDTILEALPQAVWFSELPVTAGTQAIHNLDVAAEFALPKSQLALRLLAMTYLVSQAKYVVTHTGNLGAWVAIYRGRPDGLYQFCEDGKLRGPDGAVLSTALDPLEA